MILVLKFLFLVGIQTGFTSGINSQIFSSIIANSKQRKTSPVFETISGISFFKCHLQCGLSPRCKAFNYNFGESICEIFNRHSWFDEMVQADECNMYKKYETPSRNIINPCLNSNCQSESVCVSFSTPPIVPGIKGAFISFGQHGYSCLKNKWLMQQTEKGLTHCYMQHFPKFDLKGFDILPVSYDIIWKDALKTLGNYDQALSLSCKFSGDFLYADYCIPKNTSIYTSGTHLIPEEDTMHWSPTCTSPKN